MSKEASNPTEESGDGANGAGAQDGADDANDTGTGEDGDQGVADDGGTAGPGDVADPAAESDESAEVEGDKPKDDAAAAKPAKPVPPALTPEQLKLAEKHFNGQVAAARRMLRKAEQATGAAQSLETKAKAAETRATSAEEQLALYDSDPIAFLSKRGEGVRELLNRIATGEKKAPATKSAEEKLAEIERKLAERDERDKRAYDDVARSTARKNVEQAIAADERFDLAARTQRGRDEVWEGVEEYFRLHGSCPDPIVYRIALAVENEMSADLAKSTRYRAAPPVPGATARGKAGAAGAKIGKTITNNHGSDPVGKQALPEDDDAARIAVMRQLGLLP